MFAGVTFLADNDFGDNLGDGVAGPIGLLIIVLLVIATVLLIRNMNARLRRLPDRFPVAANPSRPGTDGADAEAGESTDAGTVDDVRADDAALGPESSAGSPDPADVHVRQD